MPTTVLSFVVEWVDPVPNLARQFLFKYFKETGEVEMFDLKARRHFLKKCAGPDWLTENDLYLGNSILVHSRVLTIRDYGDISTKERSTAEELGVGVIVQDVAKTVSAIEASFRVQAIKMVRLTGSQAEECAELVGSNDNSTVSLLNSSSCIFVAVSGKDALREMKRLVPLGLAASGPLMMAFAFGEERKLKSQAEFGPRCTCCVIRPHVLADRNLGKILADIPMTTTAMETFKLDTANASDFLQVYDGVLPDYKKSLQELTLGPCVAMELRGEDDEAVSTFRKICGPWDVDFAKELRPKSLRAKFGHDAVRNAVHCTDLKEDAEMECRFFFEILQ